MLCLKSFSLTTACSASQEDGWRIDFLFLSAMKTLKDLSAASPPGWSREEHEKPPRARLLAPCLGEAPAQRSSKGMFSLDVFNLGNSPSQICPGAHSRKTKANWRPLELSFPLHCQPVEGLALSVLAAALLCHPLSAHPR